MDVVVPAACLPECGGGESGRSSPSPAASPEFEFWMVGRNPSSFPSTALLTADELFSDGIVLPLHTLQAPPSEADGDGEAGKEEAEEEQVQPLAESGPAPTPDLPAVTFKWKDIFKAAGGGGGEQKDRKKMERRVSSVGGNAELININIWPFSRSRSAGHSAGGGALSRAKANPSPNAVAGANANAAPTSAPAASAPAGRKVSSAPCSRSNSRGESSVPVGTVTATATATPTAVPPAATAPAAPPATSMLRRWVPGQGRTGLGAAGIRLGRASPVWQLRRNKLQQQATAAEQKQTGTGTGNGAKKKAVPDDNAATIQEANADADADDKTAPSVSAAAAGCRNNASCPDGGEESNPPQGLFGLRTFFSKKVY